MTIYHKMYMQSSPCTINLDEESAKTLGLKNNSDYGYVKAFVL